MHPKAILDSLGIAARKSLSQNFLTSPHWADKLVDTTLAAPDATEVWEVGPGLGALTTGLLKKAAVPVRAFEYDRALAAHLRREFPKLDLHEGDFLEADLERLLASSPRVALLSNVPYHLSSALLFRLLPVREKFPRLVLTFQREFAERLTAKPRTPDYAGLSVVIQTFFDLQPLGILPPGAFFPVPDVDSAAVVLTPRLEATPDAAGFERLVRAAFQHRRKKLTSNVKALLPTDRLTEWLLAHGHDGNARPEELSPAEYQALAAIAPP